MFKTKYIAVKNFYGPNGMERKGKEAVYNAKHDKKGFIVTEAVWKEMQSKLAKASKIAANAKTSQLSKLASKEVQAISKIVASQVETAEAFTAEVEKAFGEAYDKIEGQAKELIEVQAVNAELIKTIANSVSIMDGLVEDVNRLKDTSVVTPDETQTIKPDETKVVTPDETQEAPTAPRQRRTNTNN